MCPGEIVGTWQSQTITLSEQIQDGDGTSYCSLHGKFTREKDFINLKQHKAAKAWIILGHLDFYPARPHHATKHSLNDQDGFWKDAQGRSRKNWRLKRRKILLSLIYKMNLILGKGTLDSKSCKNHPVRCVKATAETTVRSVQRLTLKDLSWVWVFQKPRPVTYLEAFFPPPSSRLPKCLLINGSTNPDTKSD